MRPAESNGKPIEPTTRSSGSSGTASAPCAYSASRAPSGYSRSNSSRELAYAGAPVRAASGDRRPRVEWDPKPRRQGRAADAPGIDDHELVVLDEPEGAADRAEERRHALDEGVRDLVGGRSRRELGRQRSERMCLGLDPGAALL